MRKVFMWFLTAAQLISMISMIISIFLLFGVVLYNMTINYIEKGEGGFYWDFFGMSIAAFVVSTVISLNLKDDYKDSHKDN